MTETLLEQKLQNYKMHLSKDFLVFN